jgi:hypothetical protein
MATKAQQVRRHEVREDASTTGADAILRGYGRPAAWTRPHGHNGRPREAPGQPGAEPRWSLSEKDGVGTALCPAVNSTSPVWFTLGRGILTERFYPRVDRACIRDHGAIVQVGSGLAYRGIPLQSAYCAAMHAIQWVCDSLHGELIHDRSRVRLTMIRMPALNTPQFSWVKSRLPRKAQPVPPIFRPDVAADAIVWAAHDDRRSPMVGCPTVEAIVGNEITPGLLDAYLARTCYDAQIAGEPAYPGRPDNLWEPTDAAHDRGGHGDFDRRSCDTSRQISADMHLGWLALTAGGLAGLALVNGRRR